MALINTTTTGVLGSTFYGDGTGSLTIQQNGVTLGIFGNQPAFSVSKSAAQTVTSGVFTTITYDVEEFDTNNNFASNRFTPTVAGYYQINASVYAASSSTVTRLIPQLNKNGSGIRFGTDVSQRDSVSELRGMLSAVVYMNGTTDYLTMAGYITGSGTLNFGNSPDNNCFNGILIKAA